MSSVTVAPSASASALLPRPWRRAVAWLLFLGPFFFLSYGLANHWASTRPDVGELVFAWERQIPFWAWTILPYWSIDFFYALSLFMARDRDELDGHARRLLFAQVISVTCFVLFPLRFTFARPETSGVFGWLFDALLGFDLPYNQAPSLHISLLVILWTFYARFLRGISLWLLRLWAVLIGLSVLTTYQHHFIDIPTGVLVGSLAVLLFPLSPQDEVRQTHRHRWRVGTHYAVLALMLAAMGLITGGGGLWLLWPACALFTVAGIYYSGRPHWFRQNNGRFEEAVAVLLLPYLFAAWINSRLWTFRRPEPVSIVPGLWLSRIPGQRDVKSMQAVVSFCAELPVLVKGPQRHIVPVLDLVAPEPQQIEHGVAAISAARAQGNTLVYCALGYSRSATMIIAWLVAQGLAASLADAIERVRRAQPGLTLTAAHLAQLEAWHAQRIAA